MRKRAGALRIEAASTIRVNWHTLFGWVVDALKWVDFAPPQGFVPERFGGFGDKM
jgi:hypothetical protein